MTGPLGCLFLLVLPLLAILWFVYLSIVRKAKDIMSAFSGKRKRSDSHTKNSQTEEADNSRPHPHRPHQKIFDDDEGEYIDFEEIKNK